MKDFEQRFRDFPDFILTSSREIWEERGLMARIQDYYHRDVTIRTPRGIGFGVQAVADLAMDTLVAFPDRTMMGEDVICSGSPPVGMLGSQRILSTATHKGGGGYGPASGKRVMFRELADRYAKANQISDEWRVMDSGAILRQLGFDVQVWARDQMLGVDPVPTPFRPEMDEVGPYTGSGNSNQWGEAFAAIIDQIMQGELSVIPEQYDRACQMSYPGGRDLHGWSEVDAFWLGLRAAFPAAEFRIHHCIGMEEALMPPRAAIRWSLTGRHDGWGAFGKPTGADVHIMGISHAEFGPWGLRREWTLYDEAAIWMQIVSKTG
ncbi:ester cyclase [Tropicibacter sp. R15_0]|uniref:nuclear transport factor 2 family protein n=1 Tax=Tropicibacter sp. R15_0 TaxID=2821101 RepID=UPI001ADBFF19|nr:ester cyclase [Tropicibacter sp. R15_0]MBO9468342.1 ester cyclase [Tropicibacter sp. R15_0]